jgi:hypothetical protein
VLAPGRTRISSQRLPVVKTAPKSSDVVKKPLVTAASFARERGSDLGAGDGRVEGDELQVVGAAGRATGVGEAPLVGRGPSRYSTGSSPP